MPDFIMPDPKGNDEGRPPKRPAPKSSRFTLPMQQEEFPNRLLPKGTVRNLEALREASAKGRKVIKAQTSEIVNAVLDRHACDRLRHAETRRPIARPLRPNLRADGLIWRQRNYDCFEAW